MAEAVVSRLDRLRYRFWLRFQNGSGELQAAYEAVDDAYDCLESIAIAIHDGDTDEALRLLHLSGERLQEHATTLKGLL